jgi:hypothetical protein
MIRLHAIFNNQERSKRATADQCRLVSMGREILSIDQAAPSASSQCSTAQHLAAVSTTPDAR